MKHGLFLQTQDRREKLNALELARSCYLNKMDLLTNARVISDAVQLVNLHLLSLIDEVKQDKKDKNATTATTIKDLEEKDEKDCIDSTTKTVTEDQEKESSQEVF